ncbi:MAG: hypothetical protein R2991_05970 [Thermoanaerobaculia bacterium]
MRALLSFLVVAGLAVAFWTSRPVVERDPVLGTVTYRRLLGRIVAVESDRDGDGEAEVVSRYTFARPFHRQPTDSPCGDWSRHAEDRDADGRADTWIRAVGDDGAGRCLYLFEADVNGDGSADWSLESTARSEAYSRMAQIRGF